MSTPEASIVSEWLRAFRSGLMTLLAIVRPLAALAVAQVRTAIPAVSAAVASVPERVRDAWVAHRAVVSDPRPPEERDWSPWLYRDFSLAIASRFCLHLGNNMMTVAIGWLVYDVTNDPMKLGYLGLAGFLPVVSLILITGYAADRFERRIVMAMSTMIMSVTGIGLLVNVWDGQPAIWLVYLLVALYATGKAFYQPSSQALLPDLVANRHLANAIATSSVVQQIATISGPALGGLTYAIDGRLPFFLAALCFCIASLNLLLIRYRPAATARERTTWTSLLAGLKYTIDRRIVLGAISLDMFAVLLGGAIALLPIVTKDILHMGPEGLGLLRSGPAIGALTTASVFSASSSLRRSGLVLLLAVGVYGMATVGFGLSESFLLSFAFLTLVGAADTVSVVIRMTIVQVETPQELRGRVAAVNSLFITTSNEIGQFEAGTMASLLGTVPAVVVGGLGAMTVAVVWARLFPEIRDRDLLVPEQNRPRPG